MPPAARLGDPTTHPGVIGGPSARTVIIGGVPASVVGDLHICAFPPPSGPHPPTPFAAGSATVRFAGMSALRVNDVASCGATIVSGAPTVNVGG